MDFFMAPHLILGMPKRPKEEKTEQRIDLADMVRTLRGSVQGSAAPYKIEAMSNAHPTTPPSRRRKKQLATNRKRAVLFHFLAT
jgi:hypothetical protein